MLRLMQGERVCDDRDDSFTWHVQSVEQFQKTSKRTRKMNTERFCPSPKTMPVPATLLGAQFLETYIRNFRI